MSTNEKRELYRFRLPGGSYHVIAQGGSGAEARLWWGRVATFDGDSYLSGWNEYDERDQDEVLELLRLADRVGELEDTLRAERESMAAEDQVTARRYRIAIGEAQLFKASYDQAEQENRRLRDQLQAARELVHMTANPAARKERRRAEPAEGAEIPAELREWRDRVKKPFSTAWADYLEWRRAQRHPTNKAWAERQLAAMAEWGPEEAVEALEESMRQGWQGIFRPKGKQREPEPVTRPAAPYHRPIGGAR